MDKKFKNTKGFIPHHFRENKNGAGFTLLELIIVVTIIALLAAATFVAIDPAKRIGNAYNAQRWSDTTAILNAILTYVVDNNGSFPTNVSTDGTFAIGLTSSGGADCDATTTATAAKDIDNDLVGTYLATFPVDPAGGTGSSGLWNYGSSTGYYFMRGSNGRVTVGACNPYDADGDGVVDDSERIEVSR